ncbi:MAG: tRNA (guanosine(46)-N7)-methyltransferase TrmB [Deltaproteobacteria bacterium]|nr:MAG: tRNA (guanosine(46)-N7)-methyltransferase TrmB [Deltaproteobacteria bacterium]
MGRVKHQRYTEAQALPNIFMIELNRYEPPEPDRIWDASFFKNNAPVSVELGCGKGDYTVALARAYPDRNFIGIDIKSDRMYRGAKIAQDDGLENVCFIRLRVEYLTAFFPAFFFEEAWIPFPDPRLDHPSGRGRLTSARFLDIYRRIMKPGGRLHLKTDNPVMYAFSIQTISEAGGTLHAYTDDLYASPEKAGPLVTKVQTTFEQRYLQQGVPIKYICFSV